MRFSDYIASNQVFTTQEVLGATDNEASARVSLSRAVKAGRVHKAKSGLYISQSGKFQGVKADPYVIARTIRQNSVFVYHSALALHGLSHNLAYVIQFMTKESPIKFSYDNFQYRSFPFRDNTQTEMVVAKAYGAVEVTTREQTYVDCLASINLAGGVEEVFRSFSGLPYINLEKVLGCLSQYPASVASRVGWHLEANRERWSVPDEVLGQIQESISHKASYKLDPSYAQFEAYSARWHLNLPESPEMLKIWMVL